MLQGNTERAWKPNILLPVENPHRRQGSFEMIRDIAYPVGSIKLLGITNGKNLNTLSKQLMDSQQALMDDAVFTSSTVMEGECFPDDIRTGMQAMSGTFFRPNLLFLELPKNKETHQAISSVLEEAKKQHMGAALLVRYDVSGLGQRRRINLWITGQNKQHSSQQYALK